MSQRDREFVPAGGASARTGALSCKRLVSATRATTPAPVSGQQHPLILLLTCTLVQGHRSFSDVNSQAVVVYCSVIFPIDFPKGGRRFHMSFPAGAVNGSGFPPLLLLVLSPPPSALSVFLFFCSSSSSLSSFGLFCPPRLLFFFLFSLVFRPFLSSCVLLLARPSAFSVLLFCSSSSSLSSFGLFCPLLLFYFLFPLVLRPFLSSSFVLLLIPSRPSAFSVLFLCSTSYFLSSFGLFCPLVLFFFFFPLVLRPFLSSRSLLLLLPSRPSAFSVLFFCSTSYSLSCFGLFYPLLMFYFLFPLVLSRPDITVPVDWA